MNISGISPWYFYNGQKRENPQKRGNMREAFDRELNEYLERTSKKPFRECDCGCGKNVFDSFYCIKRTIVFELSVSKLMIIGKFIVQNNTVLIKR